MLGDLATVLKTTWSPHTGYGQAFNVRPRSFKVVMQALPRRLPIGIICVWAGLPPPPGRVPPRLWWWAWLVGGWREIFLCGKYIANRKNNSEYYLQIIGTHCEIIDYGQPAPLSEALKVMKIDPEAFPDQKKWSRKHDDPNFCENCCHMVDDTPRFDVLPPPGNPPKTLPTYGP